MSEAMRLPPVFTLEQVAAHLAVSVRWLREHLRQHPCGRKAGRGIVFTEADFATLIESLAVPQPPAPGRAIKVPPGVTRELEVRAAAKPPKVKRVWRRGPRNYMKTPRP
jgi:hypothetical protein